MGDEQVITRDVIEAIGVELSAEEEGQFLAHVNEVLKDRVGTAVAAELSDEQLGRMRELREAGNTAGIAEFLKVNVADLDAVVEEEVGILLGDIARNKSGV